MVEDAFGKTLVEGQPVRSGKVDPRLPFFGAVILQRIRRNPELHGILPLEAAMTTPRPGFWPFDCPQDSAIRGPLG
jgi:hypothetical protein